jgi:beta-glucanase (GH16 family)
MEMKSILAGRGRLTLLLLGLTAGCASTRPPVEPPDEPPGETADRLLFFDDFSGPALDRSRWNVVVTGQWVNNEQQAYVDDSTTVYLVRGEEAAGAENGALVLQARPRKGFRTAEGRSFDFVSGRINTRDRFSFAFARASARMRLPAGSGFWPAFWILGSGDWPATGEIDVMENVGEPDWVSSAMHGPGYSGDTPIVHRQTLPEGQDITGWHIYAVDWTPTELIFSVDGIEHYRVTKEMVQRYGPWAFDQPKFLILNLALGGAYPQGVNHVSDPYPGLPASTVQRIEAGQGKVLVDWVRVETR